jgi:hypothetical protein
MKLRKLRPWNLSQHQIWLTCGRLIRTCEFAQRNTVEFSKLETVTKAHKCKIFEGIFNQLLALKTRDMTSVVEIMTRGGSMMNVIGATELPDE